VKEIVLTIEEILKLTPYSEDSTFVDFMELEGFETVASLGDGSTPETLKYLVDKQYVKDLCNDCRCRDLHVLFYKERPFYIHQYIGRGNNENMAILDEKVYSEFIVDCVTEHFTQRNSVKRMGLQDEYTVHNYNDYIFENMEGKITAKRE
jgi:hypothetical protein